MRPPLFITATGTDIGKTHVARLLIRALRAQGTSVAALKPVVSGFDPASSATSDPELLLQAMGEAPTEAAIARIAPWRFRAPLSPEMAAAREGVRLELGPTAAWCRSAVAASGADIVIIEGAGGVMSPIAHDGLNIDLIAALDAHAVLVAGTYLGTISHILTAIEALRTRRIAIAGLVLSQSTTSPVPLDELKNALMPFMAGVTIIACARNGDTPDAELAALAGN